MECVASLHRILNRAHLAHNSRHGQLRRCWYGFQTAGALWMKIGSHCRRTGGMVVKSVLFLKSRKGDSCLSSCARWLARSWLRSGSSALRIGISRRSTGAKFLRLAEHHGVLPLVARNLIEHGLGLPPEIERSLRSAYEVNLRRSMLFTAELARIMQHFERRQLRAVPYKGAVLAQSLYRDLGLRSFSDLDFLISAQGLRASEAGSCRNRISPFCGPHPDSRTIVAADTLRALV